MAINNTDPRKIGIKGLKSPLTAEERLMLSEDSHSDMLRTFRGGPTAIDNLFSSGHYSPDSPMYNYGESKYDEPTLHELDLADVNENRYNNLSTLDVLGNGLMKMGGTALTTFLSAFGTPIVGISTAIAEGRFSGLWDNEFSKAMTQIDDSFENNFKNYSSEDLQNEKWWLKLNNASFWADDVIKNVGFTLGAAASGGMFSGALGALSTTGKAMQFLNATTKVGKVTRNLLSSLFSAAGEGAIEAKNLLDGNVKLETQRLEDTLRPQFEAVQREYEANKGTLVKGADGLMVDPAYEKYKQLMAILQLKRDAGKQEIVERSRQAGNDDFLWNLPILTLSNLALFARGFNKSFANARRTAEELGEGVLDIAEKGATTIGQRAANMAKNFTNAAEGEAKQGTEDLAQYGVKRVLGKKAGRVLAAVKSPLAEGNEEMLQLWAQSGSSYKYNKDDPNDYWRAKLDTGAAKEAAQATRDLGSAFSEGFKESYGDGDLWEQFFVGALTGALGVPMLGVKSKIDAEGNKHRRLGFIWSGGSIGAVKDYNQNYNNAESKANELNQRVNTDDFVNRVRSNIEQLTAHASTLSKMNKAAEDDDKKAFKDELDKQTALDAEYFVRAGKTEDLRDIYKSFAEPVSDEDVDNLIKSATTTISAEQDAENKTAPLKEKVSLLTDEWQTANDKYNSINAEYEKDPNLENKRKRDEAAKKVDEIQNKITEIHELVAAIKGEEKTVNTYLDEYGNPRPDENGNALDKDLLREKVRGEMQKNSQKALNQLNLYIESANQAAKDSHNKLSSDLAGMAAYLNYRAKRKAERATEIFNNRKKDLPEELFLTEKTKQLIQKLYPNIEIYTTPKGLTYILPQNIEDEDFPNVMSLILSDEESVKTFNDKLADYTDRQIQKSPTDKTKIVENHNNIVSDLQDANNLMDEADKLSKQYIDIVTNPLKVAEGKKKVVDEKKKEASEKAVNDSSLLDMMNMDDNILAAALGGEDEEVKTKAKAVTSIRSTKAKVTASLAEKLNNGEISQEEFDNSVNLLNKQLEAVVGNIDNEDDPEKKIEEMNKAIEGTEAYVFNADTEPMQDYTAIVPPEALNDTDYDAEELLKQHNIAKGVLHQAFLDALSTPKVSDKVMEAATTDTTAVDKDKDKNNPLPVATPKRDDSSVPVLGLTPFYSGERLDPSDEMRLDYTPDKKVLEEDKKLSEESKVSDILYGENNNPHRWRAVTGETGYHSNKPYHEDESLKPKDTDTDLQKENKKKRYKRAKAIYDFLQLNGVFQRVRQWKGDSKKVKFKIFEKVNIAAGDTVIFITDENGNILGDLPSLNSFFEPNTDKIIGLRDFYEAVWEEYNRATLEEKDKGFVPSFESEIDNFYIGKVKYQDEEQTVKQLFGTNTPVFLVKTNVAVNKSFLHSVVDKGNVIEPKTGNAGLAYVEISSRATGLSMAVPITTPKLSDILGKGTLVEKALRAAIEKYRNKEISDFDFKSILFNLFNINNAHVNITAHNTKKALGIRITYLGKPITIYEGVLENINADDIIKKLADAGVYVNVSHSQKGIVKIQKAGGVNYTEMISEVAITNAAYPETIGDWFEIRPLIKNSKGKLELLEKETERLKLKSDRLKLSDAVNVDVLYSDKSIHRWTIDPQNDFEVKDDKGVVITKNSGHSLAEKKLAILFIALTFGQYFDRDLSKPFTFQHYGKAYIYNPLTGEVKAVDISKVLDKKAYEKRLKDKGPSSNKEFVKNSVPLEEQAKILEEVNYKSLKAPQVPKMTIKQYIEEIDSQVLEDNVNQDDVDKWIEEQWTLYYNYLHKTIGPDALLKAFEYGLGEIDSMTDKEKQDTIKELYKGYNKYIKSANIEETKSNPNAKVTTVTKETTLEKAETLSEKAVENQENKTTTTQSSELTETPTITSLPQTTNSVRLTIDLIDEDRKKYKLVSYNKVSGEYEENSEGDFYMDEDGVVYARVTSVKESDPRIEGFLKSNQNGKENKWTLPSTAIGNNVDNLVRLYFLYADPLLGVDVNDFSEVLKRATEFYKTYIEKNKDTRNITLTHVRNILTGLHLIREDWRKAGWVVDPRGAVASGIIKFSDGSMFKTAGTLDLLLFNEKTGKYSIVDMKTHRRVLTKEEKEGTPGTLKYGNKEYNNNIIGWSMQLTMYKQLLELLYPSMRGNIVSLGIMPFKVEYETPSEKFNYTIVDGKLMLNGKMAVDPNPKFDGKIISIKETVPDFLVTRLGELYKKLVKKELISEKDKKETVIPPAKELPKEEKLKSELVKTIMSIDKESSIKDFIKEQYKNNPESQKLCDMIDKAKADNNLEELCFTRATLLLIESMIDTDAISKSLLNKVLEDSGIQAAEQKTEPKTNSRSEKDLRDSGLLNRNNEKIWNKLSEELKETISVLSDKEIKAIFNRMSAIQKLSGRDQAILITSLALTIKHRKADLLTGYKVINIAKELAWMKKALPLLSGREHLRIVNALIKCSDGTYSYGVFMNNVAYIYRKAKQGTMYHESFHSVVLQLLTNEELNKLYSAAKLRYGDLGAAALEERLADDFMNYKLGLPLDFEKQHLNIFLKFLRMIKEIFNHSMSIDSLYRNIDNGVYADRPILNNQDNMFYYANKEESLHTMDYDNITNDEKLRLKNEGISKEQYDKMSKDEKKYLFHCFI